MGRETAHLAPENSGANFPLGNLMSIRVVYHKRGTRLTSQVILFCSLRDVGDYGMLGCVTKLLGVIQSDIKSLEEV
jgi:hypothetical protein